MPLNQETLTQLSKEIGIPIELLQQSLGLIEQINNAIEARIAAQIMEIRRAAFADGAFFIDELTNALEFLRELKQKYPDLLKNTVIEEMLYWFESTAQGLANRNFDDQTSAESQQMISHLEGVRTNFASQFEVIEDQELKHIILILKVFLTFNL